MTVVCGEMILADKVHIADSFFRRLIGLMGKKRLEKGEGLLLENCASVHCFFMRMPIDAVYLSKDLTVLGVETLRPWRIGRWFRGTKHVLELEAGQAADVTVGTSVSLYK